jgi:cell division protein FtsN
MVNNEAESGFELVFDNRKLIVAFAVLIIICGCFFILGYRMGKHQGFQAGSQIAAESQSNAASDKLQIPTDNPAHSDSGPNSPKPDSADQQLDWYKQVSRRAAEPVAISAEPAPKAAAPAPAISPSEKPKPHSESVTYSLQVGAFSQKAALDATARSLKEKGFDYQIEPPQAEGQLYHVMVGKFRTRAEAAATKLRLQKNGFSAFIKTN